MEQKAERQGKGPGMAGPAPRTARGPNRRQGRSGFTWDSGAPRLAGQRAEVTYRDAQGRAEVAAEGAEPEVVPVSPGGGGAGLGLGAGALRAQEQELGPLPRSLRRVGFGPGQVLAEPFYLLHLTDCTIGGCCPESALGERSSTH